MPQTPYEQFTYSNEPVVAPEMVATGGLTRAIISLERQQSPSAESWSTLEHMVSADALSRVVDEAEATLAKPELIEIAQRVAEKDALEARARQADIDSGYSAAQSLYEQADLIDVYLHSPDSEANTQAYTNAMNTKRLAQRGRREVLSDSEEAQELIKVLAKVPTGEADESAPFAAYKNNNATAWQHVDDASVRDYLAAKPFISTEGLSNGAKVTLKATNNDTYTIPIDTIVSAAGFDSWQGRDSRSGKTWSSVYGNGSMQSLPVIKHYAGLETEVPPVSAINVYIQPNGTLFCDNGSGDSHRIAAALLRGQKTIEANKLNFVLLQENRI